jgi:hypothetical protein
LATNAFAKMRKPSTVIEPASLLRCENTVVWSWQVFDKDGGEIQKVGVSLYLLHRFVSGNNITTNENYFNCNLCMNRFVLHCHG